MRELKRKRYAKAYRRFVRIRQKKLNLGAEAMELANGEIEDKHLNRFYYYGANEPHEFVCKKYCIYAFYILCYYLNIGYDVNECTKKSC